MKSLLLCLFLSVWVLVEVLMCCEGCLKQERQGLISLNYKLSYKEDDSSLDLTESALYWVDNTTDCCQWKGVECNSTTGRIAKLKLQSIFGQVNYSDFLIFKDLKTLDLSNTLLINCTRTDQGLKNLEVLDLSENYGLNAIDYLSCLDGLSSLKSLSLAKNGVSSLDNFHTVLETISSKFLHLEVLDISGNSLSNEILPSLRGFTSLKELYLNYTELDSDLHFQGLCAILKNLEILDISINNFNDSTDIGSALSGLSSLKSLNLADSGITPKSIHNISKLKSLEILDLAGNSLSNNIFSSLNGLPHLKFLDLSATNLKGSLDITGFRGLSNLEYLALNYNSNLENEVFKSIGDLSSLKVLSVFKCEINGTLPNGGWSKLKKLEELDLSQNNFVGQLPSSFFNMTSLGKLSLTNNHFIGNISPNLASFTSLEYLNFEGNQFEFPISFTPFSNHSNLKFIYGNGNKVIPPDSHSSLKTWVPKFQLQVLQLSSTSLDNSITLPNFLLYQYNLTYVDLTGCKLRGEFPNWLVENNTKMETLILENCSIIGNFKLPSHPHLNMVTINVSNNAISGQMFGNNISSIFPNLVHLNMSRNAIHGSIPYKLSHLSSLYSLDLSDNQLCGEIPYNFPGDGTQLSSLKYLLLDGNSLSGNISSNFFNLSSIECLDISNNNFIGKIPSQIKDSSSLIELSMSNNHFEGSIPSQLLGHESITYLDLSQNNLSGCVPSFVNSSATFIHLSNNNFTCLSKNMFRDVSEEKYQFREASSLITLDLSNNKITDGIHDLIHDIRHTGINILLLKGNYFTGDIPRQLCDLTDLNILDLSYNNFVGEIPSCLGEMPFKNKDPGVSRWNFNEYIYSKGYTYNRYGKEKANFTSKKRSETYTTNVLIFMSGIDLSHNQLNGSIPSELGNLTRIRALNLSNNIFMGKIPATFSNLVQVESLDLSFNMLSGQIPPQISGLTFIEVFSVAHNSLSGATPERKGQFITFDESSYEGNQFLCGPPLPKSCNAPTLPNGLNKDDGDDDIWVDMYVFLVSFLVAYIAILLVIAAVLYINPYWRRAWFYYIGLVCMNCYYFMEDNLCKLF